MEENTIKTKKNSKRNWYILILVVGIILLIIFIIWLLMKGDVKTTGEYPNDTSPQSLECAKKNVAYSFFHRDDPSSAEVKITAVFADSKLDSISLVHRTKYNDEQTARLMSDSHEGNMNISLQEKGIYPYSLGATYSQDKNVAQMLLYAKAAELDETTIKYFMLDSVPENLTGYKRGYLAQGFDCEIKR
ncbi:hypothetical protein IKG07_00015 [Candidatus Saccharibacteria bacterium]|nr:hypothetical protein [Candidatus Saccharibacteria bacterium]